MIKKIKEKQGITLVEVVIAIGLIVILFAMFGTVLTAAYRSNKLLSRNKAAREAQVGNMEEGVGHLGSSSGISGDNTGEVGVVLDFSYSGLNFTSDSVRDKFSTDKRLTWKAKTYVSSDYGIKDDSNPDRGRYVYFYAGTELETVAP